jgi:uncharacterized membrane protein
MSRDLKLVIESLPVDQIKVLLAFKILVESGVFTALARANANHLVDRRMDWENESEIAKEIREIRQTNRILLGLEESARQLTEGMKDE